LNLGVGRASLIIDTQRFGSIMVVNYDIKVRLGAEGADGEDA